VRPVGLLSLALLGALVPGAPSSAATPAELEAGKKSYEKNCAQCHGEKGDGKGWAAPHLLPPPRDFTLGKFKIRTTPSGALPTDGDLERVIRTGMPYTSMPPWPSLPEAEVKGLVQYVKSFHAGFADSAQTPKPLELKGAPASSKETIAKGKELYVSLGCVRCHGEAGRGEGPSAPTLKDDLGHAIRAADLTYRWTFRGGPRREDIFRTFSTGLNGTPMPSFFDSVPEADRWALTDYVYSLGDGDAPRYAGLLVAEPLDEDVDPARGEALFERAKPARFPVIGQVMEPGRDFAPSATAVEVRAVYDQQRIAFLVRWHDSRADTTAKNDPTLEVPLAEEELGLPEAAPAGEGGDFWGEEKTAAASAAAPAQGDFWGEPAAASPAAEGAPFSDAVAIQLATQLPSGPAKPYFLFGDAQNPVDLWFLDLAGKKVRQFVGRGSAALGPLEASEVEGQGSWAGGQWSAVFVRDLRSAGGMTFAEGQYVPIAFSVWDGTARERGNRRGLTQWCYVTLPPREKPSVVAAIAAPALGVLALEVLVVAWIRRRKRTTGASVVA
jgi:DMSO reductase family type II enzyme heme b subunit